MNNQSLIGKIKELFKAQWVKDKPYHWIGSKLRNGKQEVPANSRNINGK